MGSQIRLDQYLKEQAQCVDHALDQLLPPETQHPHIIHQAMRHSVFAGGKRIRPILTLAAAEACQGNKTAILPTAAALEMIHVYSLIHDDLPALDNDDMRRGKLACHKAFGENIAILAGDALLTYAFEVMDARVCRDIAKAIGTSGMIGGQVADIKKNEHALTLESLEYIHTCKTGALIAAAVKAGAILSNANDEEIRNLNRYGERIGFAFQIIDDVFDCEDYAAILGPEKATQQAREMIQEAKTCIQIFGEHAWALSQLADFVVDRKL